VIELKAQNSFATSGRTIARHFTVDPLGHADAVSLQPGEQYSARAGAGVALFVRNASGEAATMTVLGGDRIDGRSFADITLELPQDGGAAVHCVLLDPAYGSLFGNQAGKASLNVDHGPILCLVCALNPGVSL
jgi:hypothetical protein